MVIQELFIEWTSNSNNNQKKKKKHDFWALVPKIAYLWPVDPWISFRRFMNPVTMYAKGHLCEYVGLERIVDGFLKKSLKEFNDPKKLKTNCTGPCCLWNGLKNKSNNSIMTIIIVLTFPLIQTN